MAEARRCDPDRWLCTLFMPAARRDAALALILLARALRRVPESVSQPTIGLIRFQWWRDAIAEAASGHVLVHPIVQSLSGALQEGRLDGPELACLIDAHEQALEPTPLTTLEALVEQAAATAGCLQAATARLLGADAAQRAIAAAAGTALGLVDLARALPHLVGRRRIVLGDQLLAPAHPNDATALPARRLQPLMRQLAQRAEEFSRIPSGALSTVRPALLPAIIARQAAARMTAGEDAAARPRSPLLPLALWWANATGRF